MDYHSVTPTTTAVGSVTAGIGVLIVNGKIQTQGGGRDVTRLVRFERDDASDAVIINPAHVRYVEDAPRSKRDGQPMTRLHMDGVEPLVVRGEMDMVAKTLAGPAS